MDTDGEHTAQVVTILPPAEDVHEGFHTSLFELTLFFSKKELDQMEEDAIFLAHKGVIKLRRGAGRVEEIDAFIRRACAHTHSSIQKLRAGEMEAVDQVKKVAGDVQTLKSTYEQRLAELNDKERVIARQEEELSELMVKWLALQEE